MGCRHRNNDKWDIPVLKFIGELEVDERDGRVWNERAAEGAHGHDRVKRRNSNVLFLELGLELEELVLGEGIDLAAAVDEAEALLHAEVVDHYIRSLTSNDR